MGVGIILTLILVTLKLAQIGLVANWSWWWVLSPLWVPLAAAVLVLLFLGAVFWSNNQ